MTLKKALVVASSLLALMSLVMVLRHRKPAVPGPGPGPLRTDFCGHDIGAYVNARDAALGSRPGIIEVNCGGGDIGTTILLSEFRTLRFMTGEYTASVAGPIIRVKSHNTVEGVGSGTLFHLSSADVEGVRFILPSTVYGGTQGNGLVDVTVRNFEIDGDDLVDMSGGRSIINTGNGHHIIIEGLYLHDANVIGIQAGGTNADDFSYAEDVWIRGNTIRHFPQAVPIAVVNGKDFHVNNNSCIDDLVCIDLEANIDHDYIWGFEVTHNVIDFQQYESFGYGIFMQAGADPRWTGPGIISNNTLNGTNMCPEDVTQCPGTVKSALDGGVGGSGTSSNAITVGIFVRGHDVIVSNNIFRRGGYNQAIQIASSKRISVHNNMIFQATTDGVLLEDSSFCDVRDNVVIFGWDSTTEPNSGGTARIRERFTSDYNYIVNNHLGVNCDASGCGFSQTFPIIETVGAHTVTTGNILETF